MIIKKFVGKTEEEATALAKKELGAGVVIMNVRPVKRNGILSFLKAQKVEVTVALEEDNRPARTPAQQAVQSATEDGFMKHTARRHAQPNLPATKAVVRPEGREKEEKEEPPVSAMAGLARAAASGKIPPLKVGADAPEPAPRQDAPQPEPPLREPQKTETSVIEEKLDTLHSMLEHVVPAQPNANSAIAKLQAGATAQPQAQQTPSPAQTTQAVKEETRPEQEEALSFIKLLYNTLLENEVDEIYANELTDEVEKLSKPNTTLDYALANVYQKMVLKFGRPEVIAPAKDGGPKAEIFIGPTGVGKTTTIAKLASKLHLQDKKKVALLTVDTYRIAAAEQLRTYASIMETPFRVIYSVEEMKQAIDDFKDYDYIMVDTAGHSLHNEEQKENIAGFIKAVSEEMESDNYLVLSATTKYRDLIEITEAYAAMVKYKLIFTKMDETNASGNLYNIRLKTGAPMSYITNGQDVPDDIEEFNAQKVVKGLLGGKSAK